MTWDDKVANALGGGHRASRPTPPAGVTMTEGIVVDVTPEGVRFTVPSFDGSAHLFGPCPLALTGPLDEDWAADAPGSKCLVAFVPGSDAAWVVGCWP